MKRAAFIVLIFIVCLFYSLSVFSASSKQNKTSTNKNTPLSSKKVTPNVVNKTNVKKQLTIDIVLEKKGEKLYVKLSRAPLKIDLYTQKIRLHTFMGRGRLKFDITPYLPKVRKKSITIFAYNTKGSKYHKTFNISKYLFVQKKKRSIGSKSVNLIGQKGKKPPGLIGRKGLTDIGPASMGGRFIPGGIRLSVLTEDRVVEKGSYIRMTYQFVRAMDHLPEAVDFRLVRRGSTVTGQLLKTVSFASESPATDIAAIREISLLLPFGLHEDGVYKITARSRFPSHSGESRTFRISTSTPESAISIFSPTSSNQFPPGMGLSIPVRYSFESDATPANVTISISGESGGLNMVLYSGPPLLSHTLSRPPDSWPNTMPLPGGGYRIVINTDDGRIGYSQIFSLAPYRFNLIDPNGGESFHTSASPWWFRWHAEEVIDRVEAVLIKGGREMFRWTPHVDPPDHLLGDSITISPEQTWHPAGTDYKLKIEGYIEGEGGRFVLVAVDESERNFEIVEDYVATPPSYAHCTERVPISIVEPARGSSGRNWEKNRTYSISWCTYDESVRSVDLALINASTGERWGIRMGVPNRFESASSLDDPGYLGGSIDWTVPEALAPGHYTINVQSTDRSYENTTHYGVYISNWLSKGASPRRSEVLNVGDTPVIEWESGGLSDQTVDIFLRHWDSRREYQIADDIRNTGRYSWRILSEALPEGITRWENVYLKIVIGPYRTNSEFFTIVR
ncbi:MAG: hypothetical protein GY707_04710 [Desulfobacteraceae bacterium]|nr:hypothetical protein [Desulfobacteraceae bacterium]